MAATPIFTHYLVINDVSLGIAACFIDPEKLGPFYGDPPTIGDNVHIPGEPGRVPYGKDQDELRVTLPVDVNGRYNPSDNSWSSNPNQQVIDTIEYLRENLGSALLGTGVGTVTCVDHQPGGGTVSNTVQVLGLFSWVFDGIFAHSTLDLIIPAGAFTTIGPDGGVPSGTGGVIDGGAP